MADLKTSISSEMKAGLENCAALGRDALRVGPGVMTSTYVERMHKHFMKMVQDELDKQKE